MSAGKGSGRRPEQKPGAFSSGYDLIFGKKEPRIGTPERKEWQDEKNRRVRELLDQITIKGSD